MAFLWVLLLRWSGSNSFFWSDRNFVRRVLVKKNENIALTACKELKHSNDRLIFSKRKWKISDFQAFPTIKTGLAAVRIVPTIIAAMAPSGEILFADFWAVAKETQKPISARNAKFRGSGWRGGATYCNTTQGSTTRHTKIDTNSVKRISITSSEKFIL